MPKPALGKVAVGDELLVIRPNSRYRSNEPIPVRVAKVGRVWVDLEVPGGGWKSYRMRLDTQNEGSQYSQQDRFVTAEQYAWEQRRHAASAYLREQGIDLRHDSPWNDEERRIVLANLLRTHEGLPEL